MLCEEAVRTCTVRQPLNMLLYYNNWFWFQRRRRGKQGWWLWTQEELFVQTSRLSSVNHDKKFLFLSQRRSLYLLDRQTILQQAASWKLYIIVIIGTECINVNRHRLHLRNSHVTSAKKKLDHKTKKTCLDNIINTYYAHEKHLHCTRLLIMLRRLRD